MINQVYIYNQVYKNFNIYSEQYIIIGTMTIKAFCYYQSCVHGVSLNNEYLHDLMKLKMVNLFVQDYNNIEEWSHFIKPQIKLEARNCCK